MLGASVRCSRLQRRVRKRCFPTWVDPASARSLWRAVTFSTGCSASTTPDLPGCLRVSYWWQRCGVPSGLLVLTPVAVGRGAPHSWARALSDIIDKPEDKLKLDHLATILPPHSVASTSDGVVTRLGGIISTALCRNDSLIM